MDHLFSRSTVNFKPSDGFPLMAGIAIAQAIEDHAEIGITLKWPNDILIDERKVGGNFMRILQEELNRNLCGDWIWN